MMRQPRWISGCVTWCSCNSSCTSRSCSSVGSAHSVGKSVPTRHSTVRPASAGASVVRARAPRVVALDDDAHTHERDAAARTLTVELSQKIDPTPGQPDKRPLPTPVRVGLLDAEGRTLAFQRDGLWYVFTRLYLNDLAIQESGNAHLTGWARSGYVQVTDGDLTDFDVVAEDLRRYCRQFDVQEIAFDPALSMYFAGKLIEEGLPLVEITQRAMFFTPALLQIENMVLEKKLKFDGNPVMTWMVSNLVVKVSKFNELMQPTKERPENKIDGVISMLMALGRALQQDHSAALDDFLKNPIIV